MHALIIHRTCLYLSPPLFIIVLPNCSDWMRLASTRSLSLSLSRFFIYSSKVIHLHTLTHRISVCLFSIKLTKRGLGADSEAFVERIHYEWQRIWKRYCVRDVTNPVYSENFLRAILDLNAMHSPFEDKDARHKWAGPTVSNITTSVCFVVLCKTLSADMYTVYDFSKIWVKSSVGEGG